MLSFEQNEVYVFTVRVTAKILNLNECLSLHRALKSNYYYYCIGSLNVKSKNVLNKMVNVCGKVVGKRQHCQGLQLRIGLANYCLLCCSFSKNDAAVRSVQTFL